MQHPWRPDDAGIDLAALDCDDPCDLGSPTRFTANSWILAVLDRRYRLDDVRFAVTNRGVDDADLIDELQPRFPGDRKDEREFGESLGAMVRFVVTYNRTDAAHRSRRIDVLSFLVELDVLLCTASTSRSDIWSSGSSGSSRIT